MTTIELLNIENFVLKRVSLKIYSRDLFVLIGPNGSGKTTLLKVIAGLVPYKGKVLFDGISIDNLPPGKREVGYVPQSIALFPHMTVEENIMFGLRSRGYSENEARKIAREYMEITGVLELKDKYPLKLSGGEKKKVAIARALAIEPKILLLDEPFEGIQYEHKVHLTELIRKINRELGKTTILVTHSMDEALYLGNRFGILVNGKLLFSGNKEEFIKSVGKYLQYINSLECRLDDIPGEGLAKVSCNNIRLLAPIEYHRSVEENLQTSKIYLLIPADKIIVSQTPIYPKINLFEASIENMERLGKALYLLYARIGNIMVKALSNRPYYEKVYVKIPIKYIHVYIPM